jgi:hypothetical protein
LPRRGQAVWPPIAWASVPWQLGAGMIGTAITAYSVFDVIPIAVIVVGLTPGSTVRPSCL